MSKKEPPEAPLYYLFLRQAAAIIVLVIVGFATAALLSPRSYESASDAKAEPAAENTQSDSVIEESISLENGSKSELPGGGNCNRSANESQPYRISISAAGIKNACIEHTYVGEKAPGQLDDPKNKWNFGWYRASATPSIDGAGVYTCHDGNGNPANIIPSICNSLNKLKVGDEISVETSAGKTHTYSVVRATSVPVGQVDMKEFQNVWGGGKRGLSIMACDGRYDKNSKRTHRFLVYAHQIQ
ncbi:MAG: class F sortase [Candidatus Saccharimonadales bacterium]